jgi:adenosylhomocysteine nucleosidase
MSVRPLPAEPVDLLLMTALDRETSLVRSILENSVRLRRSPPSYAGRFGRQSAALVQLGVGPSRAQDLGQTALDEFKPLRVWVVGYCGGLDPSIGAGRVVTADSVLSVDQGIPVPVQPFALDGVFQGEIITVRTVVESPTEKRVLHKSTGAVAVDMESYPIALACRQRGIPCSVLRAVTDSAAVGWDSSVITVLRADGTINLWRVGWLGLRRPNVLAAILKTARSIRPAERALRRALSDLKNRQEVHGSASGRR